MSKRSIVPVGVAALALIGAAEAAPNQVIGPTTLLARGAITGDLRITGGQPVRIMLGAGYVAVRDNGKSLGFACVRGRRQVAGGQAICVGRRLLVEISGSRVAFEAVGRGFRATLPNGTAATVQGQYRIGAGPQRGGSPAPSTGAVSGDVDVDINHDGKVDANDVDALLGR